MYLDKNLLKIKCLVVEAVGIEPAFELLRSQAQPPSARSPGERPPDFGIPHFSLNGAQRDPSDHLRVTTTGNRV